MDENQQPSHRGISVRFYIAVPYIPFEFAIGLWILINGVRFTAA